MAFGVGDFRDLIALLQQHPEWREEPPDAERRDTHPS